MDNQTTATIDDQIACVERELKYRDHVYGRRLTEGKMTPQLVDREKTRMRAVLETLKQVKAEREAKCAS